jgi:DNA replication and repair protein RecF
MRVTHLQLQNFRSYGKLEATFDPGVNLIVGNNAQGKTNLLESLIYLSQGSSYRTRKEEELIHWEAEFARMEAEIQTARRDVQLVYALYRGPRRRQILLNGIKQKNSAEAEEVLGTVLFCPEDLQILRAGAAVRRKFLDRAISQLRPQYKKAISSYQKLYDSKSRILRDYHQKPGLLDTLPDFNRQMAMIGAAIVGYRARYCQKLGLLAEKYHGICSGGNEKLEIHYQTVSSIPDPFAPRQEIFQQIMAHQEQHYRAELESGRCLTGPHKDDFEVFLDGRSLKSFGSQGQTRTAAIALKLSEREIARDDTGEEPVLLLDDVLSELDQGRQDFILNEIRSGQVFITCCETEKVTTSGRTFFVKDHQLLC